MLVFQILNFISDCHQHAISPIDGFALSDTLHNRGINIRYPGKVANQLAQPKRAECFYSIAVNELVYRSAKHHISTNEDSIEWVTLTLKIFLDKLKEDLQGHYSFELEGASIEEVVNKYSLNKTSFLWSFCLKTGLQLLLRNFKFDQENSPTFNEHEVLNVFSVVKHIQPKATDTLNFYAKGQAKIQQGQFKEGYELISKALNLLNNVHGALYPEITQCLRILARLNYAMSDHVEAMACQQKAVLMSEKVNGIDHSTTIIEYTHLALYCSANQQVTVALKLLHRARYLLLLNSGENHPGMAVIDSNIGRILYSVGEYEISLQFLKSALNLNVFYYGDNLLNLVL